MIQEPYIEETEIVVHRRYNPHYGNDRICNCGHPYHRHFDSYESMANVGCKYCECVDFKEFVGDFEVVRKFVQDNAPDRYSELLANKQRMKAFHNITEVEAHQALLENCLEEHYTISQRIFNPLKGIMPWQEGDPHPQDIEKE